MRNSNSILANNALMNIWTLEAAIYPLLGVCVGREYAELK